MTLVLSLFACVVLIILFTTRWNVHPFLALIIAALLYSTLAGNTVTDTIDTIAAGFGGTIGSVGLIIIAGLIIGVFLDKTGAAVSLANRVISLFGKTSSRLAMALVGYIVSIPVFCDSGFMLLYPLAKSLSRQTKIGLAGITVALAMGLLATHAMVPPTPGPIAAAAILDADIGLVITFGVIASLVSLFAVLIYASKTDKNKSLDEVVMTNKYAEEIQTEVDTPPFGLSILPILVPILLIILRSIASLDSRPLGEGQFYTFIDSVGQPTFALIVGILFTFLLVRDWSVDLFGINGWVGEALRQGALIILITGAGGAFGKAIQSSSISDFLQQGLSGWEVGLLLPFLLSALLKTAQGSSTVAIITTASMMTAMMLPLGLTDPTSVALTVVAIGAGATCVSHANDSFFWVVTQVSGMTTGQGYRWYSVASVVMGFSSFIVVYLLSLIL